MKKIFLAVAVIIASTAFPALAQDTTGQEQGIPTPKGATVVTEMNIDRDQIAMQLDAMASAADMGESDLPNIDWSALKDALGTLQRVEYAEMDIDGAFSISDDLKLFEKEVGGRRVAYMLEQESDEGILLLSLPEGGYYFADVTAKKDEKGKIISGKIITVRITGLPDIVKLAKIAGEMASSGSIRIPIIFKCQVSSVKCQVSSVKCQVMSVKCKV